MCIYNHIALNTNKDWASTNLTSHSGVPNSQDIERRYCIQ